MEEIASKNKGKKKSKNDENENGLNPDLFIKEFIPISSNQKEIKAGSTKEKVEEYEEVKPKKNNTNQKKETKNPQNNNKNQPKKEEQNNQLLNPKKVDKLELSKKDSNTSSIALSVSSQSSMAASTKSKEKKIKLLKDLNELESYPIITYGDQYTKQEEKPTINLVIIGHVDSGKSTMIGNLLCLLGVISKKDIEKKISQRSQN